ncbi:hypothetical protein FEK30_16480 (plasmid) [Picosynechococcus sp. PCC 11901]|uniref:AI-2E family transporter n=1 Tax=Picosynechococcus sp. PCC 11901 TaxID=2579791 RepID=UPI0010FBC2C7|nr:hypothetical protein [Picosynechococcus sp. PCC 11901]QCS51106.1 hypothetical protein FEK30_16480 [Picosynechococcus sp. PCC 11901]
MAASSNGQSQQAPKTLVQLLGWLLKAFLQALPRQIVVGVIVGGVMWLVHTFLLVGVNEGFNPTTNPWLGSVLVISDQLIPGTLFWLFSGILVGHLFRGTLGNYLKGIGQLPQICVDVGQQASQFQSPFPWVGLAVAIAFSTFLGNLLVSIQIALFALAAVCDPQHLLRLAAQLGWQDAHRLFRHQSSPALSQVMLQTLLAGLMVGYLIAAICFWFFGGIPQLLFLGAIAIALVLILRGNQPPSTQTLLLLSLSLVGFYVAHGIPVLADDCGWQEAGGSLDRWLASGPCVITTATLGFPAAGGFWTGWILGNLPSIPTVIYGTGTPDDPFRDYPDANNPPWKQGIYGTGTKEDPFRDYPDVNNPPQTPGIYGSGTPDDPYRDYPDANNPPWKQGIYGTGTKEDPFRDYPDVNNPPQTPGIYGSGTPDDPYRDYPDANNPPWKQGIYGTGTREDPFRDYPDAKNPPWQQNITGSGTRNDPVRNVNIPPGQNFPASPGQGPGVPKQPGMPNAPFYNPNSWVPVNPDAPFDPRVNQWIGSREVYSNDWEVTPDGKFVTLKDNPLFVIPISQITGDSGDDWATIFSTPVPSADHDQYVEGIVDTALIIDSLEALTGDSEIRPLTRSGWNQLSDADKQQTLQYIANLCGHKLGVGPVQVDFGSGLKDANGNMVHAHFDPNTGRVVFNTDSYMYKNPQQAIATIGHEVKHAQQWDPNNPMENPTARHAATTNAQKYTGSDTDPVIYAGQYNENDAESFGNRLGNALSKEAYKKELASIKDVWDQLKGGAEQAPKNQPPKSWVREKTLMDFVSKANPQQRQQIYNLVKSGALKVKDDWGREVW